MTAKRLLVGLLAIAVLAYVTLCGLLYACQRTVLYHPSPLLLEPDAQPLTISGHTGPLRGWVVNPGKTDAVIYFGGNGDAVERYAEPYRTMLPDHSIYLVPYRGYGPNTGTPSETGLEADALAVFDHVRGRHAHVALIGRSLGSGIATYVASRRPVERLVLVTPYDSILNIARQRFPAFPVSLLLHDRFESWRNAEAIKAPSLILVASDDRVIPRAHSDALIAHLHADKTVVVITNADHNNLSNSSLYAASIQRFLAASP